jgi:GNAT superfamily N-acetyltransferase
MQSPRLVGLPARPSPRMLRIRPLAATDSLESLTTLLHRAYARLGAMGLNYTAVDQSAETTSERLRGGHCLVAEWNDELVGTVLIKPPDPTSECEYFTRDGVASLRQFAVDPKRQGQGIGLALARACEAWARQAGSVELALDTAEPATHLVQFYQRMGFVQVGFVQWPGKVYRSVVMSKAIV